MKTKIKKWIKEKRKWVFKKVIDTKGGYLVIGLVIGITFANVAINGYDWYQWLQEGLSYTNKIVEIKDAGVSVKAEAHGTPLESGEGFEPAVPSEKIVNKIKKAFGDEADIAIAIAKSESGMENKIGDKPLAWNDGRNGMSCGIFQIRIFPSRPDCNEMLDPDKNIAFAKKLYDKSGWYPWSNFKNGKYLQYLN